MIGGSDPPEHVDGAGSQSSALDARLAKERRARLQAERLLAIRSEELYSANQKLSEHANALSSQVIEQREENAALKGETSEVAAKLEVATDRATRAERRLWDSLTAVEDGFAIFDRDARLVVANPAFLNPFDGITDVAPGASYDAILRVAVDEGVVDAEGAHPDDWVERMLVRWERDNIPQVDLRLWNGAFVRLIDKRTPQGDTVCLAVDITATIRRERLLQRARDAAVAASAAKSTFLANMSHEIRTPMNGVVSMAEALTETALDADQKLYADTIRHSGEALLVIINDILDYSKIEAEKLSLHEHEFNLVETALEVFSLLRPGTADKEIDLVLDLDVTRPDRLIGDAGRVRQILFNLMGNAVKFTEAGQVRLSISGGEPGEDGTTPLTLAVEDTGIGIAPEQQAQIFDEFRQAENAKNRSHDGTGLGLAITKRLVSMMEGRILLRSAPGKGSTFSAEVVLKRPEGEMPEAGPLEGQAIRLIGPVFSDRAHGLVKSLAQFGAPLTIVPRADTQSVGETTQTVILLSEGKEAEAMVADLTAQGFGGRLFHLCAEPDDCVQGAAALVFPDGADADAVATAVQFNLGAPVAVSAPAPLVAEIPATPHPVSETTPSRPRLLAAEDNKTNRLVFKTMIKSLDVDLVLVENGVELVEAYRAQPPDLIFTDISMPKMDGLEATSQIRTYEAEADLPRVPIIAMTAHAVTGDREKFLQAGLDDYLTKPLKKPKVLERIAQHTSGAAPESGAA